MDTGVALSRVRALSDEELLLGLSGSLGVSRRAVAEVVAHLGEVEERRLHLLEGHGSLFAYCNTRLGMSEDEAWRRIEVARLVRCFPLLLDKLANGDVSLSVAALLKSRLTEANHVRLLAEVSGATVRQAREVLARWFPQPDVLPLIRKLPAQQIAAAGAAPTMPAGTRAPAMVEPVGGATAAASARVPSDAVEPASSAAPPVTLGSAPHPAPTGSAVPASRCGVVRSVQPLSAERYKVQLTVGTSFKGKLEKAQDLLRHAVPSGDLATLIERALDLLIAQTTQRRFAVTSRPKTKGSTSTGAADSNSDALGSLASTSQVSPASQMSPASPSPASQSDSTSTSQPPRAKSSAPRYIPSDVRRIVHARDGGRCTWRGPDGERCECRAWLEFDHVIPVGRGGASDPANVRSLCKAHNRLAAEIAYGRITITRAIARRRSAASKQTVGRVADSSSRSVGSL